MYKLSISNIAWSLEHDEEMYNMLHHYGFTGIEIAPTRIIPNEPYTRTDEAKKWSENLLYTYSLKVSSMQSIWFGRNEKIFESEDQRKQMIEYTKKAVDFAQAVGCKNLVFGCPRNRYMFSNDDYSIAVKFFKEIGDYAFDKGTVIAMEANPVIYNTNFINDTPSAINLIEHVKSNGFKLNLDLGTMIYNNERVEQLYGKVDLINHIHISEPGLKPIQQRDIHEELKAILDNEGYQNYISVEMGMVDSVTTIRDIIKYIRRIFN